MNTVVYGLQAHRLLAASLQACAAKNDFAVQAHQQFGPDYGFLDVLWVLTQVTAAAQHP